MGLGSKYIPIIKTTDAELRGFRQLDEPTKDKTIPLFELTRSRTTSRVPEGDIHRRMGNIEKSVGSERPFILDLTSHDDLWNSQIEELLVEDNGFINWFEFLCQYDHLNIVPVIHAYEGGDNQNVVEQARRLYSKFNHLAFRFQLGDEGMGPFVRSIYEGSDAPEDLSLILDCGYIGANRDIRKTATQCIRTLEEAIEVSEPGDIAVASSSFPRSVTDHPDGNDALGDMRMREVDLFEQVSDDASHLSLTSKKIVYSDFASIHPHRYDSRGGGWVPRVDVPLQEKYIYTRYRRDDGGYARAAEVMASHDDYESVDSWGDEQIEAAAKGKPNGKSPSFWIAVRLNIQVTRKANLPPIPLSALI